MLISQLIERLRQVINEHGDLEVVSGLDRTGYGEPVVNVNVVTTNNPDGEAVVVIDLVLSDDSICIITTRQW